MSNKSYAEGLAAETHASLCSRVCFDTMVSKARVPEMSRGVEVFRDFGTFISEQEARDQCSELYGVYLAQLDAWLNGKIATCPFCRAPLLCAESTE